jgi:hypothetical protein
MVCATSPILTLLCWFLYRAHVVSSDPPCVPYLGENERGKMVMVVCDELNQVRQMALVFFAFALLWATLAVYLTFYVPRRLALLQRYVDEGNHKLGDVTYERSSFACCSGDSCCGAMLGGFTQRDYGVVTYPHVNFKVYPTYVTRRVPVLQHYTRERVTILLLPDFPFSGMPKSDIELDLVASTRQRKRTWMIVIVCWTWLMFCVLAPIYLLVCMGRMNLAFVGRHTYINWILYASFVGIVIPLVSLMLNHRSWTRYLYEITQSGQIAECQAGSSETMGTMGTTHTDIEIGTYKPPANTKSKSHNQSTSPKSSPKR